MFPILLTVLYRDYRRELSSLVGTVSIRGEHPNFRAQLPRDGAWGNLEPKKNAKPEALSPKTPKPTNTQKTLTPSQKKPCKCRVPMGDFGKRHVDQTTVYLPKNTNSNSRGPSYAPNPKP